MEEFFTSGHACDVILAVVAVEIIVLLARRAIAPLDLIGQLLAGVLLVLAVRCALTGANIWWTGLFLVASGPAHLYDLVRRRRSALAGRGGRDTRR